MKIKMKKIVTKIRVYKQGMTLPEMLVMITLLIGIVWGAMHGGSLGAKHGFLMGICGVVIGAVLGAIGAVLFMFLLALPFILFGMTKRALEPAELVCRCTESKIPVPEHLKPQTPFEEKVISESHRLNEWSHYGQLPVDLESLLKDGSLTNERISLAACLGEPAAKKLGMPSVKPMLSFKYTSKWPEDIKNVLSSGLPPRLCLTWALACVRRVLPVFESEFHQDTRPRQILGAALMFLKEGNEEAVKLCHKYSREVWMVKEAGCRVVHRNFKERVFDIRSKGQHAADALYDLARVVSKFAEPDRLWEVYEENTMADGYDSPQSRCQWSQPSFLAGHVAYTVAMSADEPELEWQWQRKELARMIIGWQRWEKDRDDWRICVEESWIPRVKKELTRAKFNIPDFIERIRKELVPWQTNEPGGKSVDRTNHNHA